MHFLSIFLVSLSFFGPPSIDKQSYYQAFESNDESILSKQVDILNKTSESTQKKAYIGALKMKISQFKKTPKEKVDLFKTGKELLEAAIKKSPKKIEYRFLRLTIQENSPKMLKYNNSIENDSKIIVQQFKSFDPVLKRVVRKYASHSSVLDENKLK